MSNIEDDIKYVKEMLEIARVFFMEVKAETDYKDVDEIAFCNAIRNILSEREQNIKKIKELEEENMEKDLEKIGIQQDTEANMKEIIERYYTANEECIPKQKVKDILNEIQEEYDKVQEQFDCIWNKKSKDNYDRYKLQELSAMQQELGFILGKFEKLLEEGK